MHLWECTCRSSLLCYWKQSLYDGIHFRSASWIYTGNNSISVLCVPSTYSGVERLKPKHYITTPFCHHTKSPQPDIHLKGMCVCVCVWLTHAHSQTRHPSTEYCACAASNLKRIIFY